MVRIYDLLGDCIGFTFIALLTAFMGFLLILRVVLLPLAIVVAAYLIYLALL